jgi:hypothetical protein
VHHHSQQQQQQQQEQEQQRQRGWQQLLLMPACEGAMNNAVGAIPAAFIPPNTPASGSCSSTCSPGTPTAVTPLPTVTTRLCTCGNCSYTARSWLQHQAERQQHGGAAVAAAAAAGQLGTAGTAGSSSSGRAAGAAVPPPAFVLLGLL